jgi:hypothetical protein
MPRQCHRIEGPGGLSGFVCTSRGGRTARCACGRPSERQCDYPLRGKVAGRTCSRHLCSGSAVTASGPTPAAILADPKLALEIRRVDVDTVDYCPAHARKIDEEREAERTARLAAPAPAVPVATRIEPEQLELGALFHPEPGGV